MTIGKTWLAAAALALAATGSGVAAQDNSNIQGEVVVTAQRASAGYLADVQPAIFGEVPRFPKPVRARSLVAAVQEVLG